MGLLALGLPITPAIGTSLAAIALTSASALTAHLASGRIDWGIATAFAAAAIAGALFGRRLGGRLDQRRLSTLFALLLLGIASCSSSKTRARSSERPQRPSGRLTRTYARALVFTPISIFARRAQEQSRKRAYKASLRAKQQP